MAVRVVTDSVADIPAGLARELGIGVVPLLVRFGAEAYRDGIDLTPDQFYARLRANRVLPATSAPAPTAYAEVFDQAAGEATGLAVITISARLSASYQAALQAVGLMRQRRRVEVIDSEWAVGAQCLLVIRAAEAARAGASLDDIIEIVRKDRRRMGMRATFDTLEYLARGGRIGKAQSLLGSILKINPIIGLREGVVYPVSRPRSRARALAELRAFVRGFSRVDGLMVEYATNPDEAEAFLENLVPGLPAQYIYLSRVSPVIGAHTGPGLLVVSVMGEATPQPS